MLIPRIKIDEESIDVTEDKGNVRTINFNLGTAHVLRALSFAPNKAIIKSEKEGDTVKASIGFDVPLHDDAGLLKELKSTKED